MTLQQRAQDSIREEAQRVGMYVVSERWPGGMLTNFKTIRKSIQRLCQIEKMEEDGTFELLPKKEVLKLLHEKEILEKNYGGIKEMKQAPDVMFVVDPKKEKIPTKLITPSPVTTMLSEQLNSSLRQLLTLSSRANRVSSSQLKKLRLRQQKTLNN